MGRNYAGILGFLAFGVMVVRGVGLGWGVDGVILSAVVSLIAFAAVGFIAGVLAEQWVEEAVRIRFQQALAARAEASVPTPAERPRAAGEKARPAS